jgi:DNA-directed RNA polymerase specialized sigma24 family protein
MKNTPDKTFSTLTKEELVQKIQELPPEHSIILSLLFIDKLSHAEASKVIGCSEDRVDQLSREALDLLVN